MKTSQLEQLIKDKLLPNSFTPKIVFNYPWRFSAQLAEEIGLLESIVLLELEYLVFISTTEKHEGEYWCYLSRSDMEEWFPFRDSTTIQRTFDRLVKNKLIVRGIFNKESYDRTYWYRLNYYEIGRLNSIKIL